MTHTESAGAPTPQAPPGTAPRRRARPRVHYELLGCAFSGHAVVGGDARSVDGADPSLVRGSDEGGRWHRCLRCDAWVPLPPPAAPTRDRVPDRGEITLPLRGRPLRDRFVLRLIAVDRLFHVLVLGLLAAAVFVFLADREALQGPFLAVLDVLQHGMGPAGTREDGLLGDARRAFTVGTGTLVLVGLALSAYALLELVEAVGLWWGRRWAEYLTFAATTVLLVPELYELGSRVTPTKVIALVVNIAVVIYLLVAKRLFGLRGGGRAEAAEHERDSGWPAVDRADPPDAGLPGRPGRPPARAAYPGDRGAGRRAGPP